MNDQCKNCTVRGDIKTCLSTECFHHENWYAVKQQERIDKLQAENERLTKLINNHYKIIEHNCKKVIADLEEENERLKQERDNFDTINAELYNMIFSFLDGYPLNDEIDHHDIIKAFENHNLKQQAKALAEYSEQLANEAKEIPEGLEHKGRGAMIYNWQMHFARELRYRSKKLRNQAKEQGE